MLDRHAGQVIRKTDAFGLTIALSLAPLAAPVMRPELTPESGGLGLGLAFSSRTHQGTPALADGTGAPRRGQVDLQALSGGWRWTVSATPSGPLVEAARRTFDIVFSLTALLLSLPVLMLVAALVKLDSRGPAVYRQGLAARASRSPCSNSGRCGWMRRPWGRAGLLRATPE